MFVNVVCIICLIFFFTGGNKKETGNSETETRTTQQTDQRTEGKNYEFYCSCLSHHLSPFTFVGYFLDLLAAHLVSLRTVKFVGRRNKRLLTKKGIGQDKKRQIADSFGVNKLSISPVWDFLMCYCVTLLELRSPRQN